MVGLSDRIAYCEFDLRLVTEPLTHLFGRSVDDLEQRDVVLYGVILGLGLGEQVLGEEVVDRLRLVGLGAGLGLSLHGVITF